MSILGPISVLNHEIWSSGPPESFFEASGLPKLPLWWVVHCFYDDLFDFSQKSSKSISTHCFICKKYVDFHGDVVFYDEWSHASIRDGITMGYAKAIKFKHNNLDHLKQLLDKFNGTAECYIVTESVFSMDGDQPDLNQIVNLSKAYNANLIIDEAHAIGVFGNKGEGVIQDLGLETQVFARIVTYGKAMGCHGAAILGSVGLKEFLVNFSRPFIYTTAMPPHSH